MNIKKPKTTIPKNISDYKILEQKNPGDLSAWVKHNIKRGWRPFGDLKISNGRYIQAMIKYNQDIFTPLSGKELAKMLDVSTATISQAAHKDHLCKGYPIAEWARVDKREKIDFFAVPADIYKEFRNK